MKISNLLTKNLIKLDLVAENKEDALQEMINLLAKSEKITSKQDFYQTILAREEKSSTGVGNGVAIPHGQSEVVTEPALVFAKSKQGIAFESRDGQPAKIFFMIAVPKGGATDHLKVLSNLSRKLMHQDFREDLLATETKEEVLEVITERE
ncbi:PTS system, fructose subfamily, IIA component [Halobacteroides halobius DSM 5150]|uniref:PTS system, fructose subfamily, IIA component n=1 Tax=Halobacteroides halobius (strain ATCC 35273 / DSM 5150 / MD-1) TaxID=748449 RepID=L0KD01_HALHC|nr:PTS sugar transporter subunit IIA [Halobacteroides halobius]AGB42420.1 PTS system, fructose subfamily, IIA component [Halobacteroides halobius DSM 5150]